MSREETDRILERLRARPHLAGHCIDERVQLMALVEQLTAERDQARQLATMLLEYSTEGLDYDTLPPWARGKQG